MDPEVLRRFRVGPSLGRGGFGEVYRAVMISPSGLKTEIALKVLRADVALDLPAVERLRREARALAQLAHPVVVRTMDLARVDGRVALITEYVDGEDLDRCLPELGPRALAAVGAAVAGALKAVSAMVGPDGEPLNVVHRDLKPTNVRVGRHGQVKLLDFGMASFRAPGDDPANADGDLIAGALPYLAPERFVHPTSGPPGDVFGLCACLYEGLTGERFHPVVGRKALASLASDRHAYDRHWEDRVAQLASAPPELADLVRRGLRYDPDARPTAEEVAEGCEAFAEASLGPTLRRFCSERAWKAPTEQGPLSGREWVEGELGPTFEAELPAWGSASQLQGARPLAEGPNAPQLPSGVILLAEQARIVFTDSTERPHPGPTPRAPELRARAGWLRVAGALGTAGGCAVMVGVLGLAALLAAAVGFAWSQIGGDSGVFG